MSTREALALRHSISKKSGDRREHHPVLYAIGERSERGGVQAPKGLALGGAVDDDAGQFRNLGDPASIVFAIEFDREGSHRHLVVLVISCHRPTIPYAALR